MWHHVFNVYQLQVDGSSIKHIIGQWYLEFISNTRIVV